MRVRRADAVRQARACRRTSKTSPVAIAEDRAQERQAAADELGLGAAGRVERDVGQRDVVHAFARAATRGSGAASSLPRAPARKSALYLTSSCVSQPRASDVRARDVHGLPVQPRERDLDAHRARRRRARRGTPAAGGSTRGAADGSTAPLTVSRTGAHHCQISSGTARRRAMRRRCRGDAATGQRGAQQQRAGERDAEAAGVAAHRRGDGEREQRRAEVQQRRRAQQPLVARAAARAAARSTARSRRARRPRTAGCRPRESGSGEHAPAGRNARGQRPTGRSGRGPASALREDCQCAMPPSARCATVAGERASRRERQPEAAAAALSGARRRREHTCRAPHAPRRPDQQGLRRGAHATTRATARPRRTRRRGMRSPHRRRSCQPHAAKSTARRTCAAAGVCRRTERSPDEPARSRVPGGDARAAIAPTQDQHGRATMSPRCGGADLAADRRPSGRPRRPTPCKPSPPTVVDRSPPAGRSEQLGGRGTAPCPPPARAQASCRRLLASRRRARPSPTTSVCGARARARPRGASLGG